MIGACSRARPCCRSSFRSSARSVGTGRAVSIGGGGFNATTVYVLVVVTVATLIRSTFGFGEALVAVPLLALRIPVAVAAPLAVLVSIVVAGVVVAQDWRRVDVRSAGWLVLAAMLGIPLGLLLLMLGNDHLVKLILGVVISGFSAYSLANRRAMRLTQDRRSVLLGVGFASGILGGAYGMNGPPLAIYGAIRGWTPQQFRATLQGYFLPASVAGLIGYSLAGLWVPAVTRYFLLTLPAVLIATLIGRAVNRTLRGDAFLRYVYAGLVVVGAMLIVQGARH